MADCKKWGDDTAGAQEEKHTYGKWNLMVSGDEMGKKGNTREEPTVARVQCFHSFCSLPLLLTRLWVEEWKSFVFMTDDTVGEQLADCLPHFYQVIFSIGEEVKKKNNRAQFVIMFFARAWHNFTVWDKLHECRGARWVIWPDHSDQYFWIYFFFSRDNCWLSADIFSVVFLLIRTLINHQRPKSWGYTLHRNESRVLGSYIFYIDGL